jgi:predicted transcriptional regulator of viral defense system
MPGRVWQKALEIALDQHGLVTFENIVALGSDPALLRAWNKRGLVEKVGHGIYRFLHVPSTPMQSYMLATLWPSGRGVLSHDTALELHELCDINPDKIHLTLPPQYRPRRRGGENYVVHWGRLADEDLSWHEGVRIVTPAVAISQAMDCAVPSQLVSQSLEVAAKLGLIPHDKLAELRKQFEKVEI